MKLLAIDDDSLVLLSLSSALVALGHECSSHDNWPEARIELEAGGFDAVLTDLHMSGTDGFEVLRRIRDMNNGPHKVIAITGDPDVSLKRGITDAGFDGYLPKPYTLKELTALLASISS
ncbi:MAG: hypothetical protein Aurels2KO_06790 [Aureliella sp.]